MKQAAIYARYSSDQQSPASLDDQIRKCRDYAAQQGWSVGHIFTDAEISGFGRDRPGLRALLEAIAGFEVLLLDDTSRLSRRLADSVDIFERLRFAGIRIVAVSQGIDSASEQADVLMTVHGLVDSLYIKELGKKRTAGWKAARYRDCTLVGAYSGTLTSRAPRVVCNWRLTGRKPLSCAAFSPCTRKGLPSRASPQF
jgi:site-specific DNA recombinase